MAVPRRDSDRPPILVLDQTIMRRVSVLLLAGFFAAWLARAPSPKLQAAEPAENTENAAPPTLTAKTDEKSKPKAAVERTAALASHTSPPASFRAPSEFLR